MNDKINNLARLFTEIMPKETRIDSSVKGLTLFRIDQSFKRIPYAYESQIIILGQGTKHTFFNDEAFTYDSSHYLVLPVPLALECQGIAKSGKPILGLTLNLDPIEVGEMLLDMEQTHRQAPSKSVAKGIYGAPMNDALYDATSRLLTAFRNPHDLNILGPMIKKEIIYRILQGEKGEILRSLYRARSDTFRYLKP